MRYLFAATALCLGMLSCKKDDASQATKTELISGTTWKYDSGGADIDRNGVVDISFETTGQLPPCLLDNTVIFTANGGGTADEGTLKCSTTSPQTVPFNWSFGSNETTLNITSSGLFGLSGQFKVLEVSSTRLGLSKDTTITGFPTTIALVVNLKH